MSPANGDLALLLSRLVLNVPYDTAAVDPEFASLVRNDALTCIIVCKWQHKQSSALATALLSARGQAACPPGTEGNPFSRAASAASVVHENSVVYYCSRSTRSFGLQTVRINGAPSNTGGRAANQKRRDRKVQDDSCEPSTGNSKKRILMSDHDPGMKGHYIDRKRLHILRLTWQQGFVLDVREIGVNPVDKTVSFTLRDSAPLSQGHFDEKKLHRAVRDTTRSERLARNEYGNPHFPREDYRDTKVARGNRVPLVVETEYGVGGGASNEAEDNRSGTAACDVAPHIPRTRSGVDVEFADPFGEERRPLRTAVMQGLALPERESLVLEVYVFKPETNTTVLGASGVTGKVVFQFNCALDTNRLRRNAKYRISERARQRRAHNSNAVVDPDSLDALESGGNGGNSSGGVQETLRIAEAQENRWRSRPHLRPFCELEVESVDALYGTEESKLSPRKKRQKVLEESAIQRAEKARVAKLEMKSRQSRGRAGSEDSTGGNDFHADHEDFIDQQNQLAESSQTGLSPTGRERFVASSKRAGGGANPVTYRGIQRALIDGSQKCYSLAWTLGRPRTLSYHFGDSRAFQKMTFWDLVKLKAMQKTALSKPRRGRWRNKKGRSRVTQSFSPPKRRGWSAETRDAAPRAQRNKVDADFLRSMQYEHVYKTAEVHSAAEQVKKYYYRAGYNNHLLNPSWFSGFQRESWPAKEFYVKAAAVEELDVLSDESAPDSIFNESLLGDDVANMRDLDAELEEIDAESDADEPLPPPFETRRRIALDHTCAYLSPFYWWAVDRALDLEAARAVVAGCVKQVQSEVVADEDAEIATGLLEDIAASVTRRVLELENGGIADAAIQRAVQRILSLDEDDTPEQEDQQVEVNGDARGSFKDRSGVKVHAFGEPMHDLPEHSSSEHERRAPTHNAPSWTGVEDVDSLFTPTNSTSSRRSTKSRREQILQATAVDGILGAAVAGALRTLKHEHQVIARRTLNRVYSSVVMKCREACEAEAREKERLRLEELARAELRPSTWGLPREDQFCVHSIDTGDHASVVAADAYGPYSLGCDGVKVIEHLRNYHEGVNMDGAAGFGSLSGAGGEQIMDDVEAAFVAQRERREDRARRRTLLREERGLRKQSMRDARRFRKNLQKRLEFLGSAHGLELREFETEIYGSEFGVANPDRGRRGPSVREIVYREADARVRSANLRDVVTANGRSVSRGYNYPREEVEGRDAGSGIRDGPSPSTAGGLQAASLCPPPPVIKQAPPGVLLTRKKSTTVGETDLSKTGARKLQSRRPSRPAVFESKTTMYDVEGKKHKISQHEGIQLTEGQRRALAKQHGTHFKLTEDVVIRKSATLGARARRSNNAGNSEAELVLAKATGGKPSASKSRSSLGSKNENDPNFVEFQVLRAARPRLLQCEQEENVSRQREGRKSAEKYYLDRSSFSWEAPAAKTDVFAREKEAMLEELRATAKDTQSRGRARLASSDFDRSLALF
ncbi:unnamed protein product [Amoebophrya sp. A25]|nr:unnamed protein product [Amoebophrya sp. A25]|eukprot:GSA25T00015271001.1